MHAVGFDGLLQTRTTANCVAMLIPTTLEVVAAENVRQC